MNGKGNPHPSNEITIAGMFRMSPESTDPSLFLAKGVF